MLSETQYCYWCDREFAIETMYEYTIKRSCGDIDVYACGECEGKLTQVEHEMRDNPNENQHPL